MPKTKKKKILYIITKSNFGGAQKYVYDLVTNIPITSFESVVAFGGEGRLKNILEQKNIRTISISRLNRDMAIFGDITVFLSLLRILFREKPDIVHLNSSKIGILGALASRIYNILAFIISKLPIISYQLQRSKIVFTAHGFAFNEQRQFFVRKLIKFISWLTILLTHNTITVSEYDKNNVQNMPFVKHKILNIHNGTEKNNLMEKQNARKILLNETNPHTIWIGTITELTKNKGLHYALDAARRLVQKNIAFVWIIIGSGEDENGLRKKINKYKLEKYVYLAMYKENASELLSAFDMFVLPSVKEGLPYVLLEAGLAGLPTTATHVGGIPEIIKDMESGILIRPKEDDEIAQSIEYLIKHKDSGRVFGEKLKTHVEKEFSLNKMVKETLKVYNNM